MISVLQMQLLDSARVFGAGPVALFIGEMLSEEPLRSGEA